MSPFNCRLSKKSENVTKFILTAFSISSRHIFKVKIAYGYLSIVTRTRNIGINPNIELHFVLHILNLSCNLPSIGKLIRDLTCSAHFFKSSYVFQDLILGKKIDNARECERLYYFEKKVELNKEARTMSCKSFSRK